MEIHKLLGQLICSFSYQEQEMLVRLIVKNGSIDDVVFNHIVNILKQRCLTVSIVDLLNEILSQESSDFQNTLKKIIVTEDPFLPAKLNRIFSIEDIINIEPCIIKQKFCLLKKEDIQCLLKVISPTLRDYLLNNCGIFIDDNIMQKSMNISEVENAINKVLTIFNTSE